MIKHKLLEFIFSAPSNISVLRILNERNVGISGREVSRLTGLSVRAAQVALINLSKCGVVKTLEGNRENLYSLDRQKYLSSELVEKIFLTESNYKLKIRSLIKSTLKGFSLSLIQFGSTARGNETIASDLDLCIVYENKLSVVEEKVSKLRTDLFKRYNITLAPFYISIQKFRISAKKSKSPVNDIIKEGIVICGKTIKELLNG
ncbi:MAG: nucleotidyltransferase domain-containing protein [Ignavibacteriaceae bacterium]